MQENTKRLLAPFLLLGFLFVSSSPSAVALTASQAEAISVLMRSFGADEAVVKNVQLSLDGSVVSKAAQSASRASVQVNKKTVFQNQALDGDIDPEGPVSSCVALTTNLRYRSRDARTDGQVSLLQDFLQSRGFLNSEPTGYFGLLSLKAVKAFQKSVGIEPTGFVGVLTRAKIKELSCGDIVPLPTPIPTPLPKPIPMPVPSNLEVISPNGGESWQKGTIQTIRWAQRSVSTSPASPAETSATGRNAIVLPLTVNISLTSYTPPCVTTSSNTGKSEVCPAMPTAIYLIASNAPNTGEYRWPVGATTNSNTTIPDGAYVMQVCAGSQCDQSNSYFKIFSQSGENLPPVIDGVSGPTVLDVGQLGIWSVRAYDPENGPLSYIVNWGDDVSSGGAGGGVAPLSISASQTTTFTHNYSRAGAYEVRFTVTDSKGLSVQSSISVNVGAAQPSITVLSPNGGENWQISSTQTIRWSGNTGGSVNISLSNYLSCWESNPACMAPAVLYQIASGVSGSSYNWTVGKAQNGGDIPAGQYKVTVSSVTSPAVTDQSDSYFTIAAPIIQPSISVLSPKSGDVWQLGESRRVEWQYPTPIIGNYYLNVNLIDQSKSRSWGLFATAINDTTGLPNPWIAWDRTSDSRYSDVIPGSYMIEFILKNQSSGSAQNFYSPVFTITAPPSTTIVGRHIFYNNSVFDGNNAAANVSDDSAIATDKQSLLSGGTATFANYTSYSRGINGIMVDVKGVHGQIRVDDFEFKIGNNNASSNWSVAPAPLTVSMRPGAGVGGSDRVTILWTDSAIQKQWLRVLVKSNDNTRLITQDVFYFGNAIAEVGDNPTNAEVTTSDIDGARLNQRSFFNPAPIEFNYDFNRDTNVDITDINSARLNQTNIDTALKLITPPVNESSNPSLNSETVSVLAEFSQKKNLNLASILAAIQQLIEAFK